jgi:hypothetical protein
MVDSVSKVARFPEPGKGRLRHFGRPHYPMTEIVEDDETLVKNPVYCDYLYSLVKIWFLRAQSNKILSTLK